MFALSNNWSTLFEEFILVKLYTDGREELHTKNRKLEISRFGTAALHYYVVLTPNDDLISSCFTMITLSFYVSFLLFNSTGTISFSKVPSDMDA